MSQSNSSSFVIDSNVLIQAKNQYYAFDLCSGFWNSLIRHKNSGQIFTVQPVVDEILKGDDDLSEWVEAKIPPDAIVDVSDSAITKSYATLIDWVESNKQFRDSAKFEYASSADGWIMAFAHAYGHTVVTQEVYVPNVQKRVPMPNVCNQFGIPFMSTFEMLRELSIEFVCAS